MTGQENCLLTVQIHCLLNFFLLYIVTVALGKIAFKNVHSKFAEAITAHHPDDPEYIAHPSSPDFEQDDNQRPHSQATTFLVSPLLMSTVFGNSVMPRQEWNILGIARSTQFFYPPPPRDSLHCKYSWCLYLVSR